uniref:Aminomethyltransferase folate-binding domain-containing protein n=1 Tax=Panagrolaimus sp. PS1159 TaxID=55785 RepID=A0AC35GXR0_9BILA
MQIAKLAHRALLSLKGPETLPFLQGLLTKDLNTLDSTKCAYSFLLNAKGRIVADFIIYKPQAAENEILLETDADRIEHLEKLFTLYRLRKKVEITKPSTEIFFVFPGSNSNEINERCFVDPRVGQTFGSRFLGNAKETSNSDDYLRRRLEWGIGEGYAELKDQIPLNINGDFLNGISYDKGCYIGQELIARTHHTGIIRSRLLPFKTTAKNLKSNSSVLDSNGKRRGKVIKIFDGFGISIVSIEGVLTKQKFLSEDGESLEFSIPKWWPIESNKNENDSSAPKASE